MRLFKLLVSTGVLVIISWAIHTLPIQAQSTYTRTTPGDIEVEPQPGPSLDKRIGTHASSSWPRYIARDSGLIAVDLLVMLMISGIGLVTGLTFKFIAPITAWTIHRAMGLAFAAAVGVHIFVLLFDHMHPYTLLGLLMPFVAKPVSAPVVYGILAFYGILTITLTSLIWKEKKPHTWKLFHLLSYLVMVLVFFHALYMGTDLSHGLTRFLWKMGAVVILVLGLIRLRRTHSL